MVHNYGWENTANSVTKKVKTQKEAKKLNKINPTVKTTISNICEAFFNHSLRDNRKFLS